MAGLPVGLHLRAQRRVPVEALHTLHPTQGLGPVDSVSIYIFIECRQILYPHSPSFDILIVYIHYNYIFYDAFMTVTSYK